MDQLARSTNGLINMCGSESVQLLSESFPLETGSDKDVTLIHKVEHRHRHEHDHPRGRHPHVHGFVDVREGSDARITLEINANGEDIPFDVEFGDDQKLTLYTPPVHHWSEYRPPCLEVKAVVYLPEGAELDTLSLHAVPLDVTLYDGLKLGLRHAELGTVSGDVRVREGALARGTLGAASVSGDIKTEVPVSETIRLETASGDISLTLLPVSDPDFKTSSLSVSSVSGKVGVRADGVPAEVSYAEKFSTVSGNIDLALPFASAEVSSTTGTISASLTPIFAEDSSLRTHTLSGDLKLAVQEPAKGKLDSLESRHDTTSGTQKIGYPDAWEGEFDATSFSGNVKVQGKDVKVGGVKRGVTGGKGDGKSRLKAKSFSGNIDIIIGEE